MSCIAKICSKIKKLFSRKEEVQDPRIDEINKNNEKSRKLFDEVTKKTLDGLEKSEKERERIEKRNREIRNDFKKMRDETSDKTPQKESTNVSSNSKGKIFRAIIGFIFTSIFLFVIAYSLKDLDKEYLLSSINMLNIFNLENNVFPVLMSGFAAALAVGLNEYNRRPTQPLKWYITLAIVAIFYLVIFSLTFLELENLNPSTILTIFFTNIALLILGANISK